MESLPLEEFKDRQIRGLIHVDVFRGRRQSCSEAAIQL